MALGQFGDACQRIIGLLIAMAGQAQFDYALDRQADLFQVYLRRVAGDDAAGFEFCHPFGHCRRRQIHLTRQLRKRGPAVFEQGGEQHAVVLVHGVFLCGFDSFGKHYNNRSLQSVRVI
ncbi:hypothetical protein D3C81_1866440 [compost metagenome]